ncbi:hypothetical protein ABMA79_01665 [Halobacteriovorax sp. HFRX-2_2]|uniref:hypothetical protein n=1 Tax=unclassified Halobacteriovorax TaxID=2639665 RepID=UPI003715D008
MSKKFLIIPLMLMTSNAFSLPKNFGYRSRLKACIDKAVNSACAYQVKGESVSGECREAKKGKRLICVNLDKLNK